MRKSLIIIGLLMNSAVWAQNQYLQSQYMYHQAFVNPGAVASYNEFSAALFYRNQWTGFTGSPVVQGFSIANPLGSEQGAWGAQFLHDRIGVNNSYQVAGTYAYKVQLSPDLNLGLGLSGVLNMAQGNYGSVETIVPNDPVYRANSKMSFMPNFRFGAYVFNDSYFAGFAVPNLLKNQIEYTGDAVKASTSLDPKDLHMYLHGGYKLFVSDAIDFSPSALMRIVSGSPVQIDLNANFMYQEQIGFGLTYRTGKTVAIMASYVIDNRFLIGYSYDFGFSNLAGYARGSHEVMLTYQLRESKTNETEPGKKRVTI